MGRRFTVSAVTVTVLVMAALLLFRSRGAAQSLTQPGTGSGNGIHLTVVPVTPTAIRGELVYTVKTFCGSIAGPLAASITSTIEPTAPLVPGSYLTSVQVHNPDDQTAVQVSEKYVVSNPRHQSRGRVSPPVLDTLGPDEALEVDCSQFIRALGFVPGSGFVVIRSRTPLDVVAVYTGMSAAGR